MRKNKPERIQVKVFIFYIGALYFGTTPVATVEIQPWQSGGEMRADGCFDGGANWAGGASFGPAFAGGWGPTLGPRSHVKR